MVASTGGGRRERGKSKSMSMSMSISMSTLYLDGVLLRTMYMLYHFTSGESPITDSSICAARASIAGGGFVEARRQAIIRQLQCPRAQYLSALLHPEYMQAHTSYSEQYGSSNECPDRRCC